MGIKMFQKAVLNVIRNEPMKLKMRHLQFRVHVRKHGVINSGKVKDYRSEKEPESDFAAV